MDFILLGVVQPKFVKTLASFQSICIRIQNTGQHFFKYVLFYVMWRLFTIVI